MTTSVEPTGDPVGVSAPPSGIDQIFAALDRWAPGHGGRYAALDGFRALAALAVVLHHVGTAAGTAYFGDAVHGTLANLGNYGVAVFFILSGFLLYRPFVHAGLTGGPVPEPRAFLVRRLARLLPAYWVAWLAYVLFVSKESADLATLVRQFFLVDIYAKGGAFRGLPVSWTLTIELSFAIGLAAFGPRLARLRTVKSHLAVLAAVVMVSLAWKLAHLADIFRAGEGGYITLFGYMDWLALGMAAAVLSSAAERADSAEGDEANGASGRPSAIVQLATARRWSWLCAGVAFALVIFGQRHRGDVLSVETTPEAMLRHVLNGLSAALLVFPALLAPVAFRWRWATSRVAVFLGVISYGIFLWHKNVMSWWFSYPAGAGPWKVMATQLVKVLIPAIVLGALSFRYVEQPLIRASRRWRRTPTPPTT